MVQSKGLRSGTLAKAAEVSPDTIRHYEKIGVSHERCGQSLATASIPRARWRESLWCRGRFESALLWLKLAEVLKARDAGGAPCQRVYELAQGKLKAIEADIEALKRTKRYLQKVLADWEERTQRAGPGQQSHLLYSLSEAVKNAGLTANQFRRRNR